MTLFSEGDFQNLAAPARRALASAGVSSLDQLAKFSEAEIEQWHGIGPNALLNLRKALEQKGFTFRIIMKG